MPCSRELPAEGMAMAETISKVSLHFNHTKWTLLDSTLVKIPEGVFTEKR